MVGLGEERDELVATIKDLRGVGCGILTIGQYLRPTAGHAPMVRYYHPDEFARSEAGRARAGLRARRVRPARAQLLPRPRNRGRVRRGAVEGKAVTAETGEIAEKTLRILCELRVLGGKTSSLFSTS